jgi:2',3'-cyclic-nucleotide 2'-phosphodiesterase (5'-nucleotidase family)
LGGLSEKANSLRIISQKSGARLIGVDAGNALFRKKGHYLPETPQFINAEAIAEIYTLLGLDAVAVGPADLSGGLDLLRETGTNGLSWVSANLFDGDGDAVFPAYISIRIDNLSIAIVGITGSSSIKSPDFIVRDAAAVLAELLPGLDHEFDLIIMLSAMSLAETNALIEKHPQIDIAVAADNGKANIAPFLSGTTLVTQTGNRGRYQGVLSIQWNGGPLGESSTSVLPDLRKRLQSTTAQLDRLLTKSGNANPKTERIAQLRAERTEIVGQIEDLEKVLESEGARIPGSTYEYRFLPLVNTGRSDPQIDYIIQDAKKRISALASK